MASLICWASGLLEVVVTGKVPDGCVTIAKGQDSRLRCAVLGSKHVEYVPALRGNYLIAVRELPEDDQESRMSAVLVFQGILERNLKDPKRRMK